MTQKVMMLSGRNMDDCNLITWGIGAGFYNDLTWDTLGWSMKTCYSNGKDRMKCTDTLVKRYIPGKVSL